MPSGLAAWIGPGAGQLRQRSEDVGLELFLDVVVEEFVGVFYGQRCREYDDLCRAGVALVDLRADGEAPVHDHQVVVPGILRDRDPFGVGFVAAQAGIAPTIRDFGDDVDPRAPDALDRTACGAGRPVAVHAVVDFGCGVEFEFLVERDVENVAAGGNRDRNLDLRVEVAPVDEHQFVLRPVERIGRRVALDADLDFRAGLPDRHRRGGYPFRHPVDRPLVIGFDQDRHREIGAPLGPGQVDALGFPFVIGVGEAGFAVAVFEVAVLVDLACAQAEAAFERTARDRGDDLALAAHLEGYLADARVVELIEFGHADYDPAMHPHRRAASRLFVFRPVSRTMRRWPSGYSPPSSGWALSRACRLPPASMVAETASGKLGLGSFVSSSESEHEAAARHAPASSDITKCK